MERDVSKNEKPDFSKALAVGRELDLKLPDSQVVRDAYAQAEAETSQPWLFNHVIRSSLYGAKLAQRRGLTPDTTRDNFIADFGMKYVPGYMRLSSVDFLHQSPFAE